MQKLLPEQSVGIYMSEGNLYRAFALEFDSHLTFNKTYLKKSLIWPMSS